MEGEREFLIAPPASTPIKGIGANLMISSPLFERGAGGISNEPDQNPPKFPFKKGDLKT